MADRGLALLDASTLLMVVEERGELRVAASSGRVSVRVRVLPLEGSALGALYATGKSLSLDSPTRPGSDMAARAGARSPRGARGALQHGWTGWRACDRGTRGRRLPRSRPARPERVRGERRPAACGRALGRDRASALRHGGPRARAHTLGARDPRRNRAGARCVATTARQRTRPRGRGRAQHRRRYGARGPRSGDRRSAPPDHRASPRRPRRLRAGAGA